MLKTTRVYFRVLQVGFIQRNILSRFWAPRIIISDKGSHFENKVFAKLTSRYGIKHMVGLAYMFVEKTVNTRRKD